MTSRLKKKLTDIGVDVSSRKANENFCLVREFMLFFSALLIQLREDWDTPSAA
jgi:hypothetical protein